MPKPITMPYIIDEAKNISIVKLRKWKYLMPNNHRTGLVTWSKNGIETSSISIAVAMKKSDGILTLTYKCNGKDYSYDIKIISKTSNLGKGNIFYFICPFTFITCRKLHFYNEHFIHRSAIKGGMYSKQIESKKYRDLEKIYGCYFKRDRYFEALYSKNFKRFYNGKPTKKYLKLKEKIKQSDKFTVEDIQRLLVFGY